MNLIRREFCAGLGCLMFAPSGMAMADKMPMRAIRQFPLGDMNVTVIDDGSFTMGVNMFAANAKSEIGDLMAMYGLDRRKAEIPLQVMLIETDGIKVLIDTGMGDVQFHGNERDSGRLVSSLATLGLKPSDIDILILSHGHPDHVGGLSVEGERVFTTADHYIPEVEFKFWTQKPERAPAGLREMIEECRRHLLPVSHGLKSYDDGQEIAPGVFAVAAPGHTHGHFAIRLESRGQKLLHLVDTAVHFIAGLERPDWHTGADLDKKQAVETRKRLLTQAAEEQLLVAGYHFPFPGIGRVLQQGNGFRYVPMPLV